MLHQFLAILFILIVTLVVIYIFKVALPMWRFIIRANAVIELYPFFKKILKRDFSKENKIRLIYNNGICMYILEFSNTCEASFEFEKIVKEALEYYDKLGAITFVDNSFKVLKEQLIQICSEVRIMRWQKQ